MTNRILIIDDEPHIRRMMRLTLEAAGYDITEARDGAEGLVQFGDGLNWAGVILDQRMPGMDGLDTLREIKNQNPDARVVMATAYASIELAVDAMKLGATDFVRKPMTPEILRNAVAAALMKKPARPVAKDAGVVSAKQAIQTITMNGYTILDDEETRMLEAEHRRFIVVSPEGERHEVLVEIDPEVIGFVERMTARRLPPGDSFWTSECRKLLSDYLWNEGKVPPTRRLVLKDLDPDRLAIAARWKTTKAG